MANITLIPEDYGELKKEYLIAKKELDATKQDLYDKSRKIECLLALEKEYQAEIELLQSEDNKRKEKYQEQVMQLEESVNAIKARHNQRVQDLEAEISTKADLILKLETELQTLKLSNCSVVDTDDTIKLIDEINILKDEKEAYINHIDELKSNMETSEKINICLENTLKECKEELASMKEILSVKSDELLEARDLHEQLNDELLELRNDLESLRSKPLDKDSKGNSLFAEVDDRRVYLQNVITKMKPDYITMKQEHTKHLHTIRHLRLENMRLLERWQSEQNEVLEDEDTLKEAYKARIADLELLIDKYKSDLKANSVAIKSDNYEYYNEMLKMKDDEIEELRSKLISRGLTDTLMARALRKANEEKRKWRVATALKDHLLQLKSETALDTEEIADIRKKIEKEFDHLIYKEKKGSSEIKTDINEDILPREKISVVVSPDLSKVKQDTFSSDELAVQDIISINDSMNSSSEVLITTSAEVSGMLSLEADEGATKTSAKESTKSPECCETFDEERSKENIPDNDIACNKSNVTKRVKFSSTTVSPVKQTRGGRNIYISKPTQYYD